LSTRPPAPKPKRRKRSLSQIFAWPTAIAAASIVGLITPLAGDGIYQVVSWVLLGGIVVLMVRHLLD
jgi:hypothetical protein